MAIDFSLPPEIEEQRQLIAEFLQQVVLPAEAEAFAQGVDDSLRTRLQKEAKHAGVWAPQAASDFGGGGYAFTASAVLLEEAGYSLLGPLALNCAAPDEGNIHLLDRTGSAEQRERYLRPLVAGDIRSCFSMTEPPPGAGSDPGALRTTATRVGGGWLLEGEKWLITGADGATFSIVMALNRGADAPAGATMFLVDADNPGFVVGDHLRTIDSATVGGHCRVSLHECFVPDSAVLGEAGRGFAYAQVRLVPARLTHCMRWLGAARRAHDIAVQRAVSRELFGRRLVEQGMAQQLIAENEIDLAASRALLWQACWTVGLHHAESGSVTAHSRPRGLEESSRAKVFVSEAASRVVDRSVQLAGGMGTSEELILGRIYADIRAFRIYDGATEAHKMAIAKRSARRAQATLDAGHAAASFATL